MLRRILFTALLSLGVSFTLDTSFAVSGEVSAVTNCNGTQVVRTEVGQLQILHVEKNLPGCVGTQAQEVTKDIPASVDTSVQTGTTSPETVSPVSIVTNCNGNRITRENGATTITHVEKNLPGCIGRTVAASGSTFDPKNGPAFDIRSTDIANYRTLQMQNSGIRYVNPVRSVKMRTSGSMLARVKAFLMRNDAVVVSGKETGWVKSQGASVNVYDTGSNVVVAGTGGKALGYIAAKYLRLPNKSDLVRIGQADQAYWSDVAHTNVAHLVNVREHPWYGAKIKFVLSNKTNLYVVSTVDNWSEVISDDRVIHGFVRSDFILVDKAQRVDR